MKHLKFKQITAFAVALISSLSMVSFSAFADEDTTDDTNDSLVLTKDESSSDTTNKNNNNSYSNYYDANSGKKRPNKEIIINADNFISANDEAKVTIKTVEGKDNVVNWESQNGEVTFKFTVEEEGLYNLFFDYYAYAGANSAIELAMKIDDEVPYDTASRLTLNKVWKNEYGIKTNDKDNQVRPPQVQEAQWIQTAVKDIDGLFNDPLLFYLTEGEHTLTFSSTKAGFAINYLKFYNEKELNSYDSIRPSADEIKKTQVSEPVRIEGEDATYKSDATLYPTYDRTSYMTSPSHPVKQRYNTIGAGNWKKSTQTISWEVKVTETGYYKIGIKARQNVMRGFYSNRRLYINGEVPCAEAAQIKFPYSSNFELVTLQDDNDEDMYFKFEAGQTYNITLEAIPGDIGDSMRRLDQIVYEINQYYRKILMITGPTPDEYNDYFLYKQIPTLLEDFKSLSDRLYEVKKDIEKLSERGGSEAAALERMAITLDKCIENPNQIHTMLSNIKDNVTSMSAWMRDYRDQPLEIDYIELTTSETDFASIKSNIFKSMSFGFKAFIGSFFEDYNQLSDTSEDALNVWVALGRDQAQAVKDLVDSHFVDEYKIPVSINLVQGSILEATLAGKGPDIALFYGGEFPVNLAMRDTLVDLTQFDDFDEVSKNFQQNALTHYTFNNGVYGLPVSQVFPMMFYRTDILAELGYDTAPETWDDLVDMLPDLQRNFLEVGLVLPVIANNVSASPATESGHTFALMMLQSGLNYYNDAQTATNFTNPAAVNAFEKWTKFYTTYSFLQTYDGFSRFRTGEMPILIQNYTFYNQLSVAAPEIKGLWDFTSVPGTVQSDGTISHAANSNGGGALIFDKKGKGDNYEENAWTFIKWFTSTDTQVKYGNTIEALMGTLGRFDTANLDALDQLSWSTDALNKIKAQRDELKEIPIIPASYVVTRSIMNAFRKTVNDADNPRDTLIWYNRDINSEILRKRKDIGLD